MKRWVRIGAVVCFSLILAAQERENEDDQQAARQAWFYNQRAFPLGRIPAGARLNAIRELQRIDAAAGLPRPAARAAVRPKTSGIVPNSSTWTLIGRSGSSNN